MKSDSNPEVLKLATKTIRTSVLKEKLNSFYETNRLLLHRLPEKEHFDYLWDLKERAILEGKKTVEVPEEWMAELDSKDKSAHWH
jgi:hypothetical protein